MRIGAVLLWLCGCTGEVGPGPEGDPDVDVGGDDAPEVDLGGDDDADDAPTAQDDDGVVVVPDPDDEAPSTDDPADRLCASCSADGECGAVENACVQNQLTGERFCARSCALEACPDDYYCLDLGWGWGLQCIPDGDSCGGGGEDPVVEDPPAADPPPGGEVEDVRQFCVDEINRYRAAHDREPLARSDTVEACADGAAEDDSQTRTPHGHFTSTGGCGGVAFGENEIPGWSLAFGTVEQIIASGLAMMMQEGPGGGHYENMLADWTEVGCGVFVTDAGEVWAVQDFR